MEVFILGEGLGGWANRTRIAATHIPFGNFNPKKIVSCIMYKAPSATPRRKKAQVQKKKNAVSKDDITIRVCKAARKQPMRKCRSIKRFSNF